LFIALVLQRLKQPKQPSHSPATNNFALFFFIGRKKKFNEKIFFCWKFVCKTNKGLDSR